MKNGIHPNYEKCTIRCACGEVVETRSTKGGEIRVDICSKCHPFFTGKQKFVDAVAWISSRRESLPSRSDCSGKLQKRLALSLSKEVAS